MLKLIRRSRGKHSLKGALGKLYCWESNEGRAHLGRIRLDNLELPANPIPILILVLLLHFLVLLDLTHKLAGQRAMKVLTDTHLGIRLHNQAFRAQP